MKSDDYTDYWNSQYIKSYGKPTAEVITHEGKTHIQYYNTPGRLHTSKDLNDYLYKYNKEAYDRLTQALVESSRLSVKDK